MRGITIRIALLASLVAGVVVAATGAGSAGATMPPPEGRILASLSPPDTFYFADVSDPDGDPLSFDWTMTSVSCGTFTPGTGNQAVWSHPGTEQGGDCPHDDGFQHPGTIVVMVSDGTGNMIRCEYSGSLTGQGPPCQVVAEPSPSPTESPSPTPTESPSPTPTESPSPTPSPTPTETPPNGVPVFDLPIEPEIKPPCDCEEDSSEGSAGASSGGASGGVPGGISFAPEDPCPKCEVVGDYPGIMQDAGAYSVYLHSGEFFLHEEDLRIAGRGFDYGFERTYRSGIGFDGPLGANWDFNHNRRLVVATDANLAQVRANFTEAEVGDVARMDGSGRADLYALGDDGDYRAPTGFYTTLTEQQDGGFVERDYQGTRVVYAEPDSQTGIASITSVSDRNGNTMRFDYDADGRLTQVVDTLGRAIDYHHDAAGRLQRVTDFAGRSIAFEYDGFGDLVEVTGPAVTGTPNGNDFPDGKTERYTYSSGFGDPRLSHDLLSITAPNEVMVDGPPRLMVTYDTDVASPYVGRVLTQTVGGTNATGVPAGGSIGYEYGDTPGAGGGPDDPVSQTTVTDRSGNVTEYLFNGLGNILSVRELTNRDVRSNDPESFETTYRYNDDGELIQQMDPEVSLRRYDYDAGGTERLRQGNLLAEVLIPDVDRGGDQDAIETSMTYEPIYNKIRTETDARGNDPGYVPQNGGAASAARYTTVHTFDYQEGQRFDALAQVLGVDETQVQDALTQAGMPMGLGDVNGDGTTSQIAGNVIRVEHPTVKLLPACAKDRLSKDDPSCSLQARREKTSDQPIVELFAYNDFGQRTRAVDPEGNTDLYRYHPANDPDGDGQNLTDGVTDGPFGYLMEEERDAVARKRMAPPTRIRNRFLYDRVGNLIREVDGRGIATDHAVNQLNQIMQTTRAAEVGVYPPDPVEPNTPTAFSYLERFFYDANDNLVRQQTEDRGDASGVGGDNAASGSAFVDRSFRYDILDHRIERSEEVSDDLDLVTHYRYDANENRVLVVAPEGNAEAATYDERDLIFTTARGATAPPPEALLGPDDPRDYDTRGGTPATNTFHYDGNRNLVEMVDAADTDGSPANASDRGGDGDRMRYQYDGFDRLTSVVDPVGNQSVFQYDPLGTTVRSLDFGPTGGPSPAGDGPDLLGAPVSAGGVIQSDNLVTSNLLSASESLFDELTRLFRSERVLFVNTIPTARPADVQDGARDLGKVDLTPDDDGPIPGLGGLDPRGRVSTRMEFDRNSRPTFAMEDDGDVHRMSYDGADRMIATVDPEGNVVRTAFDDNDNVIEIQETDRAQVGRVAAEVFLTTSIHDSLDRLQRRVDNLGQTTDLRYDSRDNVVARANAKGPPGPPIDRRAFAGGARTENVTNLFGNVTLHTYDGLDRRVRQDRVLTESGRGDGVNIGADLFGVPTPSPTPDPNQGGGDGLMTSRFLWDGNSLQTGVVDDNGNRTAYAYDNLDRVTRETRGICEAPALADRCDPPTEIGFGYDPDDNLVRITDENGSVTDCAFDAADRRTGCDVTRAAGVVGTTETSYQYDGLSRVTRASDDNVPDDPSDDSTVTMAYDSLSRIIEEGQALGDGTPQAISSAWRAEELRSALTYPNDRIVKTTFDGLDRIATIRDAGVRRAIADYDFIGPGRVLQRTYPISGAKLTFLTGDLDTGYDGLRRPVGLRHLQANGGVIVGFSHHYDRENNKLTMGKAHDAADGEDYEFDSADRLIGFDRPDPGARTPLQERWTLDGVGNWQQVDDETRLHSSFNEIVERDGDAIISDDIGNVTDDGENRYAWDYQNRLRRVTRDGELIAEYTYDALGRRVRKLVTSSGDLNGEARFYLDGWREIEERDGAGALVRQHVFGRDIDEALVMDTNRDANGRATDAGDRRLFYHEDTLSSVRALTDSNGSVVEGYEYDAYGRQTVFGPGADGIVTFAGDDSVTPGGTSPAGNPFMFTGRRLDAETKLYFYRARFQDPVLGRFLSRDPEGHVDGMNLYEYARSNPTRYTDPSGRAVTVRFIDCDKHLTAAQKTSITSLVDSACDTLKNAVRGLPHLESWNPGAGGAATRRKAMLIKERSRLQSILTTAISQACEAGLDIECECNCPPGRDAYVPSPLDTTWGSWANLHLCPPFYRMNAVDQESTLLHEMTHFGGSVDEGTDPLNAHDLENTILPLLDALAPVPGGLGRN
ncbi:MAG: RHS repeat-associated core domain-containing protein [Actinomycetota bacterium]